jgi:hypothetical protein
VDVRIVTFALAILGILPLALVGIVHAEAVERAAPEWVEASKPMLTSDSTPLTLPRTGDQFFITTTVKGLNCNQVYNQTSRHCEYPETPILIIIEVRNSDDTTDFIGWQSGILKKSIDTPDDYSVGMSWIPDHPGAYVIRTFVLSELENPRILSDIQQSNFKIIPREPPATP